MKANLALLKALITLMRPRQWIKNSFVLAPLVFSGLIADYFSVINAMIAALLFCLASSATYIANDIHDIEQDRKHPEKIKKRPLASGAVTIQQAFILLVIIYGFLLSGYFFSPAVFYVIALYLGLNIAYTFVFKYLPIIDIFSIAIGFVLRVYAGTVVLNVPTSPWMMVTTLCLALFLAAIKRRQELLFNGNEGRKVLKHYTVALVERYAEISGIGALMFYSLFVMTVRPEMVITIPFVLFGIFRYWFLVESLDSGESPTDALMTDWQLGLNILLWIIAVITVIWPKEIS